MGYMDVLDKEETIQKTNFVTKKQKNGPKNFEFLIIIAVILIFVLVMANRLAEVNLKLDVESDFANAKTMGSAIRQTLYVPVENMEEFKDTGKLATSWQSEKYVPLENVKDQMQVVFGEIPKIRAQKNGEVWNVIIDVEEFIVKIFAGDIQLYPRLQSYEHPYNAEYKN